MSLSIRRNKKLIGFHRPGTIIRDGVEFYIVESCIEDSHIPGIFDVESYRMTEDEELVYGVLSS